MTSLSSVPTRIWVGEVELSDSLLPASVSRPPDSADTGARLLVRLHRRLLGFVSIPLGGDGVSADDVWAAVTTQLAEPLRRHLDAHGLAVPDEWPAAGIGTSDACVAAPPQPDQGLVTVVVCSRNRPVILANCLKLLQQLHYVSVEVVVVDNAPSSEETRDCFERLVGDDDRFRYVREPVPGLSRARNCGLDRASTRYVAFTDDDVQVDPWWLEGILAGFASDALVGCVTGLAPAAELDDPAQHFFDRRYSWSSHMEPRVFDLAGQGDESPLYPYSAGLFGTGANFAVDRELFTRLGGFDEALGAGSPAGGGEDLDAFVRVLRAGRSLAYEPSAIVWHVHRADARALRRQLFYYGAGLTAFLTKYLVDVGTAREILARLPEGARRGGKLWSADEIGDPAPKILILAEVVGMLAGPFAYLRGRLRLRSRARDSAAGAAAA